ncbi:MAG: GNAT family N-acetyltransferase [Pseudomonadota bacterium]
MSVPALRPAKPADAPTDAPADAPAIAALHTASWLDAYAPHVPGGLPADLADRHRALWDRVLGTDRPANVLLLAEDAAGLAGFVATHPDPEDPALDYLAALHVAPSRRGQAIGARLMAAAARALVGRDRLWCHVLVANAGARRFYARLGGSEGPPADGPILPGVLVPECRVDLPPMPDLAARAAALIARRSSP